MDIKEFVQKVFTRYQPEIKGNDTLESLMTDYIKALNTGKTYNYDNAFIELMRSYSYKTLPTAKILLEILSQNEIKSSSKEKPLVFETIIAEKNGYKYEYGIETTYTETKLALERQGFTNIRLKFPRE